MSDFDRLLADRREAVEKAWLTRMIEDYPPESGGFLSRPRDASQNPTGQTLATAAREITAALVRGAEREELEHRLDPVIRMRAVQSFTPARALAFLPALKGIVGELFATERRAGRFGPELSRFADRVDELTLLAFNVYVGCREQIHELRAGMMRDRSYKLMERAGLLWEEPGESADRKRGDSR